MSLLVRYVHLALCLLILAGTRACATQVNLKWVEVDISPTNNGKATLVYKIRYQVLSGELHGFYFEGFGGASPYFDYQNSNAVDSNGRKYGLSISPVSGDKYDIVLANGAAVSRGEVTYIVLYGADLLGAGQLGPTQSEFGKLTYLNWSPVQWDLPMEHMTIYLHYPIRVQGKNVSREFLKKVGFRTEKFVNTNYLISYYGQPYNGQYFLTVRFHKKNPPARYQMRVQCYIDSNWFPLTRKEPLSQPLLPRPREGSGQEYPSSPPVSAPSFHAPAEPIRIGSGIIGLAIVGLIVGWALKRRFATYSDTINKLDQISWESGDWAPPKIKVSSFRQKGKIADLDGPTAQKELPAGPGLALPEQPVA